MLVKTGPIAVEVVHPERGTAHIGPFPTQKVAEQWTDALHRLVPEAAAALSLHDPEAPCRIDPADVPEHVEDLLAAVPLASTTGQWLTLPILLACKIGEEEAAHRWQVAQHLHRLESAVTLYTLTGYPSEEGTSLAEAARALSAVLRDHRPVTP